MIDMIAFEGVFTAPTGTGRRTRAIIPASGTAHRC
jgi:hypothetical protein